MSIELKKTKKIKTKSFSRLSTNTRNTNASFNIRFGNHSFSNKKKLQFFSDLSVLLSSGVDIVHCLQIVEENFKKPTDKAVISQLQNKLEMGLSLSAAMLSTGRFSPYEYYSIEIGEETGTINSVVDNLVVYYKRMIEQKRKIVSAFSYPIMVLFTAAGAMGFMLGFVVPMFEEIFLRSGRSLPWITQVVIDLSAALSNNGILILFTLAIIIVMFYLMSKKQWFKKGASIILLKIPYFGGLAKKIYLLRLCTAFELLLKAHTPLLDSLELLKKMITFYPISSTFNKIAISIQHGDSLFESMKAHSIYESRMLSLVKVAEQVNLLGETFATLKDQYTDEVNYKTSMMGSVLEPILIIFVGLIVGIILVSMYLPIFEFSSSMSV